MLNAQTCLSKIMNVFQKLKKKVRKFILKGNQKTMNWSKILLNDLLPGYRILNWVVRFQDFVENKWSHRWRQIGDLSKRSHKNSFVDFRFVGKL